MKVTERALRECSDTVLLPEPVFQGYYNNKQEERGHFFQLVYVVDATGVDIPTHSKSQWFPVDDLPVDTVENNRHVVIPMALGRWDDYDTDIESFAFSSSPE